MLAEAEEHTISRKRSPNIKENWLCWSQMPSVDTTLAAQPVVVYTHRLSRGTHLAHSTHCSLLFAMLQGRLKTVSTHLCFIFHWCKGLLWRMVLGFLYLVFLLASAPFFPLCTNLQAHEQSEPLLYILDLMPVEFLQVLIPQHCSDGLDGPIKLKCSLVQNSSHTKVSWDIV